mgnify:FL=1
MEKFFRIVGNVFWIIFGGIWLALIWGIYGIALCLSSVGIPFGVKCFKLAAFSFLPKRKKVILDYRSHPVANILWLIFVGWQMLLLYLIFGVANCVSILGIPKGVQCFKIMKLALFPFGASVKQNT